MPLAKTSSNKIFAMLNLLGPEGVSGQASIESLPTVPLGVFLHWYKKKEIRPHRKLGHINGVVDKPADLPALLATLKDCDKNWFAKLKDLNG